MKHLPLILFVMGLVFAVITVVFYCVGFFAYGQGTFVMLGLVFQVLTCAVGVVRLVLQRRFALSPQSVKQ